MSKMSNLLATSRALATAAVEEASRFGVRVVDIEHVFLALTITERRAGEILRGMGITLDDAREAVAAQHREQLASLGIDADLPGDGTIRFHEQGGYDYTERAMRIMSQSGGWKRAGDSTEILRNLVTETSGTIERILARLGTDPAAVIAKIDDTDEDPRTNTTRDAPLSRTDEVFVPAEPSAVWALVSDPGRLPEWEQNLTTISAASEGWTGTTRTVAPDGRTLRVRPNHRRQSIECVTRDEPRVVWRMRFPDAPRANSRLIEVHVAPATGGSSVTVRFAWERGDVPRGLVHGIAQAARTMMRPLARLSIWIQVHALTSAISRALR